MNLQRTYQYNYNITMKEVSNIEDRDRKVDSHTKSDGMRGN